MIKTPGMIAAEMKIKAGEFWRNVRVNAAIAAMQGLLASYESDMIDGTNLAKMCVIMADALVDELRKEE